MLKIISLYRNYKSVINVIAAIILIGITAKCVLDAQYSKGVTDGKVAVRVENVNETTKEIRKNIKDAVVIVTNNLEHRIDEIDKLQGQNTISEITDPVLKEEYENPDLGISEEMFASINQARAETVK